ncbi:hypothetical protein BH10BAC4_BH10BAC4_12190 [soil metagenome]
MEPYPSPITEQEVKDFHAAHPLSWWKPEEFMPVSLGSEFDLIISGSVTVDSDPTKKTFLEATNPWLLRPDGEPEEKMSFLGKAYLGSIKWVFRNAMNELIKSEGQILTNPIIIAGMTVEEYLKMIKLNIENEEEFKHISDVLTKLDSLLHTIHKELIDKQNIAKSRPSLLERLEGLQRHGKFSATKEEEVD